jgi:metal-responsive CopG/Arc/MetJ family transcriptional regulator
MTKRLNITIPEDIARRFDKIPNKSKFIAEAIKEKLDELGAQKLKELLTKSYKAVKEEDKIVSEEWENVTLERWNQ